MHKKKLTARERQIARLVMNGLKSKEIAVGLEISVKTVDAHRANIYRKLGVHNAVQMLHKLKTA